MAKYVFITGGVVSSLGKGIAAASLGLILKSKGYQVENRKFDPYLNIDPGTMNPYQHGEVFVTDDGAETDLDIGHYERFTGTNLSQSSNTTAGRVYREVFEKERKGEFHGGTVQVIPNITGQIREHMLAKSALPDGITPDVIITEVGGTVGDIESLPFIEAARQIKYDVGPENCCYIHLTLLPYLKKIGELKTKPTQHSVKELQGQGIQPDIVMLRSEIPIDDATREKLALYCNVPASAIIQNLNARSIYEVPLMMEDAGLGQAVCAALSLEDRPSQLGEWRNIVERLYHPKRRVAIALVGKYIDLRDAYLSVVESLLHAGVFHQAEVVIDWVDAEKLTGPAAAKNRLKNADGVIVPGGFGDRGIEGMILAARYARENGVPYFGICLGMQIMSIEFARNVLGLKGAHSTEMNPATPFPVIALLPGKNTTDIGGTLRLGKYECVLTEGTLARKAYGRGGVWERHRHRYEFNNAFLDGFEGRGMEISGVNPRQKLVEIIEAKNHPWMLGCQFHPEFKSRPDRPHPLFRDFVGAAVKNQEAG
ncbi:MAG: CTP synthase [Spirochaetaceae bacterium]|jgi:CTP synthase|nr:CTP synthase [Spirochaetaceae bacterium]